MIRGMKRDLRAACLLALSIALGYICFISLRPEAHPPQIIHIETAPTLFHGVVRGIPCVENRGNVECLFVVAE